MFVNVQLTRALKKILTTEDTELIHRVAQRKI